MATDFAQIYNRVRELEGRLYDDKLVAQLPHVAPQHPHSSEWRSRAASARRLTKYLQRRPGGKTILELGCGNGWLANYIAHETGSRVYGVDRSPTELAQAARVFASTPNLVFIEANVFTPPFSMHSLDVIVLASAVQYFPDLPMLLSMLHSLAKASGEIHILDSPLYAGGEVAEARERSQRYYTQLGVPEMIDHYHHHPRHSLMLLGATVLHDSHSVITRLRRWLGYRESPFPWLRLVC